MGQAESVAAAAEGGTNSQEAPPAAAATKSESSPSSPLSLEDLITEATNFGGNDENESLDVKAQRALECPCVAELRKGPCGTQFSEAFVCFIKSTAEEKGSDCISPFIALQYCIKANPNAFSKDVLEDESEEEEVDYKIIPPSWSKEPKSKGVSKL